MAGSRARLSSALVVGPTERHVERGAAPSVTSVSRISQRLREAVDSTAPASRALVRLAAKRAAERAKTASERVGIAGAVDATIGQLARSGVTAADLRRTGTPRGVELARMIETVDATLASAGRVDPRRALASVTAARLSASAMDLPEQLYLEGTVDLEPAATDMWLAVHHAIRERGGRGVALRLPRLPEPEDPLARLASALEARLADDPDPLDLDWFDVAPRRSTLVVEAHGVVAEARAAAAAVLAGLDAGAAPDAIFVAAPGRDEPFLDALRASFREAAIPFSEAWGPPVASCPEARSVIALVRMAVGRLDRDGLIELLHTPGLHPGSLVRERDEGRAVSRATKLASRLRALPVVQDRDGGLFVEVLRAALVADGEDDRGADGSGEEGDFWMVGAMEKLADSIEGLRKAKSVERFTGDLLALIDRLRLGEPSATEIAAALAAPRAGMRAIGEGAVAVRAVREALEALRDAHRVLGSQDEPASLDEIAMEIEESVASVRTAARGAAGRAAAVRVGDLVEALGLSHERIVVTRMTGRAYAAQASTSLLDEATRRALPPSRRPRSQRDRANVREAELAWALHSAKDVVLSYSSVDDAGHESDPPHPRLVAALAAGAERRVEPASRVVSTASSLSARGRSLVAIAAGARPPEDLAPRVAIELDRQSFFATPSQAPGRFTGSLDPRAAPVLAARIGGVTPERAVAVTFVGRAATCAFRAFADRVLRARSQDEIRDVLAPNERGDLLHRALHAAFESDRHSPPSATVADRVERARVAIERVLDAGAVASPLRREGRTRVASDALAVFGDEIASDTPFRYREGERRFGSGEREPWGPLEVTASLGATARSGSFGVGGPTPDDPLRGTTLPTLEPHEPARVYLEGRIDRIDTDLSGRHVRVVDYKTGRPKRSRGDDPQLPLYALVARRMGADRVSAVYYHVGPGGSAALVPTKESDREIDADTLNDCATHAAVVIARLWTGYAAPRPVNLGACAHCDARGLCRRPAVMPEASDDEGAEAKP